MSYYNTCCISFQLITLKSIYCQMLLQKPNAFTENDA